MSAPAAGGSSPAPPWSAGPPVPPGLRVVHADAALLVFDKPAGLLAVPGRGEDKQDCLAARAQAAFPDALVVHRLDMATSGLIVMARGLAAQRALNLSFEKREVHKQYEAVVQGLLAPPHGDDGWGVIDLPLILDWLNRPRSIVDNVQGRPSRTRWRVLAHDAIVGTTRVLLEPVTGRSHQLRVHLQALGHPIVGDRLYAAPEVAAAAPRLLLHAQRLALFHPATGEPMVFDSAAPF
jgi:tRNA pseudouridine32 synthase/23S rRNA pseudouridine746 synthase